VLNRARKQPEHHGDPARRLHANAVNHLIGAFHRTVAQRCVAPDTGDGPHAIAKTDAVFRVQSFQMGSCLCWDVALEQASPGLFLAGYFFVWDSVNSLANIKTNNLDCLNYF